MLAAAAPALSTSAWEAWALTSAFAARCEAAAAIPHAITSSGLGPVGAVPFVVFAALALRPDAATLKARSDGCSLAAHSTNTAMILIAQSLATSAREGPP